MIDYSKGKIVEEFNERYIQLSDKDKQRFAEACNKLLAENFIYGQRGYDEELYNVIRRLRFVIEYYFALIDFDLYHEDKYKIFFIKSRVTGTRVKFKKLETVILLILAKLYRTKSINVSLTNGAEASVLMSELLDEINKTRIYKDQLYKTDVTNALKTLKKYKIINISGADIAYVDAFTILPTILFVVTDNELADISNSINSLILFNDDTEEEETNETDED